MHSLSVFEIVLAILLTLNIILIVLIFCVNRHQKNDDRKQSLSTAEKEKYMEHNIDFYRKSAEITAEIRRSLNTETAENNEHSMLIELEKCSGVLKSMHGGSAAEEALIHEKKSECSQLNIRFIDEIHALPSAGKIAETHVISLMGNLFDNAIEACKNCDSAPYIKFSSTVKKNVWFLKVYNSKNPDLNLYESGMETTKKDASNHGLGMHIIKDIIKKHSGTINMYDEGAAFETTCLLLLNKSKKQRRR